MVQLSHRIPEAKTAVDRVAQALRAMALAQSEGALLGSEDELMTKIKVSRPTLRQGAALVVQEQLIRIRRGVNGGYFVSAPKSYTVARIAAIYLQLRGARLADLLLAVEPVRGGLARLAARNHDPAAREQLQKLLEDERVSAGSEGSDYRAFLRAERAFARSLGALSRNPVLELFLDIIYDLAGQVGRVQDVYVNRPERIELYREHRNRMILAILDGDEDMAVLATRRCSAFVTEWLDEDLARRMAPEVELARTPAG
jgi:DNA-binding FadR family transcriptional regulator